MPIDNCQFSFQKLADTRLPHHMQKMLEAASAPQPMSLFAQRGAGKNVVLKQLGLTRDFQGCYVLIDDSGPIYVGISRSVIQRLIQHVKGKTHHDAALSAAATMRRYIGVDTSVSIHRCRYIG